MMNLYPDADLSSSDYDPIGSAISKVGASIVFDDASQNDYLVTKNGSDDSALGFQVRENIPPSSVVKVSVFVTNYIYGDAQMRLRTGGTVPLGITGNGWSAPVSVQAGGVSTGAFFRGYSGGTSLVIEPDPESGEAVRITAE